MTKTVCIIGAGPSGLVAAKVLLHPAHPHPSPFSVTIFDAQPRMGGLWPASPTDGGGLVHPLMVANQSRHTVQFSDHAWPRDAPHLPRAWLVGRYLESYARRWLSGAEVALSTRVVSVERIGSGNEGGWMVKTSKVGDGDQDTGAKEGSSQQAQERQFDYVVVAAGFFGRPIVDADIVKGAAGEGVPVVHSSAYRDLGTLLGGGPRTGGKILVVGGQASGVEIAGTIASHIASSQNSPEDPEVAHPEQLSVHHLIQRPVWVFPLYTSPVPDRKAPPFLPLDMPSYNLSNRPAGPLVDTQGHISRDSARTWHAIFQNVLGTDQAELSPSLSFAGDDARSRQPYVAMSEHYADFVREGAVVPRNGRLEAMHGTTAAVSGESGEQMIEDVAAVVLATGFDASPSVGFLPGDVLQALHHDPAHVDLPVALAFHGTHHPDVPGLGFVGFYRSPYWGIMEMQARLLAALWTPEDTAPRPAGLSAALASDVSVRRTLDLRTDPRRSQFPMGDYAFIMAQFAAALDVPISAPSGNPALPPLPHNGRPIDLLTPARHSPPRNTDDDVAASLRDAHETIYRGLTTPLFVARGVFRSLLGTWRLERDLASKLPSHPSGHFSGTARFLLRAPTTEARACAADAETCTAPEARDWLEEYLYVEEGEFRATNGLVMRASRRYVWRYDERRDVLSVWFVRPEEPKRVDYLFHELEFAPATGNGEGMEGEEADGWEATAGHLCVEDFYDIKYRFVFRAVNLDRWTVEYGVQGPAKDYTIKGEYRRR